MESIHCGDHGRVLAGSSLATAVLSRFDVFVDGICSDRVGELDHLDIIGCSDHLGLVCHTSLIIVNH